MKYGTEDYIDNAIYVHKKTSDNLSSRRKASVFVFGLSFHFLFNYIIISLLFYDHVSLLKSPRLHHLDESAKAPNDYIFVRALQVFPFLM